MRFIHRRYRLCRVCCTLALLCSALLLLAHHSLVYRPSDLAFLELNACPACFGVHLCQLFGTDRVQLAGACAMAFRRLHAHSFRLATLDLLQQRLVQREEYLSRHVERPSRHLQETGAPERVDSVRRLR